MRTASALALTIATLVITSAPALAQVPTGTLTGTVTDQATQKPIEGASIQIRGADGTASGFTSRTKADGTYEFRFNVGTYTFFVTRSGYMYAELVDIALKDGGRVVRDVQLTPARNSAPPRDLPQLPQGLAGAPYPVLTFPLQSLSADAAAKLLAPYMPDRNAGVFDASNAISAITVRAPKEVLNTVDSLLRVYDHAPATITLHFKLIAASDSAVARDAAISEIDATLRQMFRYGGYRQIAEGTTTISEHSNFMMTLTSGGANYELSGSAGGTSGSGANLSQQLTVRLYGSTIPNGIALPAGQRGSAGRTIVSTGLTVPVGQMVVIGGATGNDAGRTLILVVRPDVTAKR